MQIPLFSCSKRTTVASGFILYRPICTLMVHVIRIKLKTILAPKMRVKDPKRPNLNLFAYLPTRGVGGKISEGAKTFFLLFFSGQIAFSGRKFPFGRPKTNFRGFEKWQKVRSSPHFVTLRPSFSIFHLPFFNFPSFLLHFPLLPLFFLASLFPVDQQNFLVRSVGGGLFP